MKTKADKAKKRPWLVSLAANTYGKYLKSRYCNKLENKELLNQVPGACIVMSNHCHIIDPCFISNLFPFHIRWVTGAYLFKLKILGSILDKQITCISKKQGRSDLSTIMTIKKALKAGNCVGLFPEGSRTWDGDFLPLPNISTAKMVHFFKVPVVFLNLEGAYAKKPRWADKARKGRITIKIQSVLSSEEIKNMKIESLYSEINQRLGFSHDTWEDKNKIAFPSKYGAEGLQRVLYICPKCGAFETLQTKGNEIVCKKCGCKTIMDEFLRIKSEYHSFTKVREWRNWQIKQVSKMTEFPTERGILLQTSKDEKLITLSKSVKVNIKNNCFNISYEDVNYNFNFDKISSLILNAKQTIEFYHKNQIYRVRLLPNASSLKYLDYFTTYKNKKEK